MGLLLLTSREGLNIRHDTIVSALHAMLAKTGARGQSVEVMMKLMYDNIGKPRSFLLIHEEETCLKGILYCLVVEDFHPWIEVICVWCPNMWKELRDEAFELLDFWAKAQGAERILTTVSRHYLTLFTHFYEPLGFKQIGILIEREVDLDANGRPSTNTSITTIPAATDSDASG